MNPLTFLGLVAGAALLPVLCDLVIDWWSRARTDRFVAVDDTRVQLRIPDESRPAIDYLESDFDEWWTARQATRAATKEAIEKAERERLQRGTS